jgi:hypothetical protein
MRELNEISRKNPFKVPNGYFEEVNLKIISTTAGIESEVKKQGIFRILRPYFAAAAVVAGLVLLSYTAIRLFAPAKTEASLSGISLNEVYDSYFNDIDILTLEEIAVPSILNDEKSGVNKNDIIDYLVLENIDTFDIYELL